MWRCCSCSCLTDTARLSSTDLLLVHGSARNLMFSLQARHDRIERFGDDASAGGAGIISMMYGGYVWIKWSTGFGNWYWTGLDGNYEVSVRCVAISFWSLHRLRCRLWTCPLLVSHATSSISDGDLTNLLAYSNRLPHGNFNRRGSPWKVDAKSTMSVRY